MWNWIWYLLLPIILLLLLEEVSHLIWRSYLKNPEDANDSTFARMMASVKANLKKVRKDPSH